MLYVNEDKDEYEEVRLKSSTQLTQEEQLHM